jgi:acetoin utilization deacetylase AcuC-like enzyme
MTTALFTHPSAALHETPHGHPESRARMRAVWDALAGFDLDRREATVADDSALLRCHPQHHLDALRSAAPVDDGLVQLDGDTWMGRHSIEAAWRAAGGAVAAVDAVLAGEVANAFVAMRPPGHHAERAQTMGFCLLGSVAIAARHALEAHGLSRVAVVDFDVHHGNGTQDLLWDEARALTITSQQMPLWPGTGARDETGAHGTVINLPLPGGSDGAHMRKIYEAEVFPALAAFGPELVLISAGFDAHREDPLAGLNWSTGDFTWLTERLCDIAAASCGGRVVSCLEGGYDLDALGQACAAHVTVLMERGQ